MSNGKCAHRSDSLGKALLPSAEAWSPPREPAPSYMSTCIPRFSSDKSSRHHLWRGGGGFNPFLRQKTGRWDGGGAVPFIHSKLTNSHDLIGTRQSWGKVQRDVTRRLDSQGPSNVVGNTGHMHAEDETPLTSTGRCGLNGSYRRSVERSESRLQATQPKSPVSA